MFRTTAIIYLNGHPVTVDAEIDMADPKEPEVYRTEFQELMHKVNRLENRITNHMGETMKMNLSNIGDLIYAIQNGQRIQAIMALRTATPGLGLKEAKDMIESGWSSRLAEIAEASNQNQEPEF